MDTKRDTLHVLMFPWLAHGHISPYLELAKRLSQRNFHISFCSTPVNLSSIRKQLDNQSFPSIQLVELHLPSLSDLPPRYHTTNSLPPHLMSTLKNAFDMAEPSFSSILRTLKPDLLIYDHIQPWAPVVASRENIPAVHFLTYGAVAGSFIFDMCKHQADNQFMFPSIHLQDHEYHRIMDMLNSDSNMDRFLQSNEASNSLILIKSFKEIEEKYINYFSLQLQKELVPVGPLIREPSGVDHESETSAFMAWLDKKEESSVVFVSFGTEYFMSNEEITEIARGLELSKVNFIWVIRFPKGEEIGIDDVLPNDFLERIGERGMLVKDWAPQANILAHCSVGGFMSHCGWSSLIEGLHCGVPIIAMPMQHDQPMNARLMVELGVGMEVERENEKFVGRNIANVINEVVAENKGQEVRQKAKEISEKMRKKRGDEIDVVVEKFQQIRTKHT